MQVVFKVGQMQKMCEVEQSSKRRVLVFLVFQVGEGELEEIVKMGMIGERVSMMVCESDNDVICGLVGNYIMFNISVLIRIF